MNNPPPLTTRNKIGIYIVYGALLVLAGVVVIFLRWAYQTTDVLEVKNSPFPVRTIRETPAVDGVVILKVDYCKKTDTVGRVRTSFVSSSREVFLPVTYDRQLAQCQNTEVPIVIPHDMTSGRYRVKFHVEYQVNPIKTAVEEFESVEFDVVGQ